MAHEINATPEQQLKFEQAIEANDKDAAAKMLTEVGSCGWNSLMNRPDVKRSPDVSVYNALTISFDDAGDTATAHFYRVPIESAHPSVVRITPSVAKLGTPTPLAEASDKPCSQK